MDNGTPGKKPPASSARKRPAGPMMPILRKRRVQAGIEGLRTDIWSEDDYSPRPPNPFRRRAAPPVMSWPMKLTQN